MREREALTQRVSSLEEGQEVMRAELASAQADLATAQSHATSQQVTVDKVSLSYLGALITLIWSVQFQN